MRVRLAAAPTHGGIDFQTPVTEVARNVQAFHNEVLIIITVITAFVTALLIWVIIRYNKRANPVPKKFSHNTLVEIVWTVVPVLILVWIAKGSFPLLYEQDVMPSVPEDQVVDIKVYGNMWYWGYTYGEGDEITESRSCAHRAEGPAQAGATSSSSRSTTRWSRRSTSMCACRSPRRT